MKAQNDRWRTRVWICAFGALEFAKPKLKWAGSSTARKEIRKTKCRPMGASPLEDMVLSRPQRLCLHQVCALTQYSSAFERSQFTVMIWVQLFRIQAQVIFWLLLWVLPIHWTNKSCVSFHLQLYPSYCLLQAHILGLPVWSVPFHVPVPFSLVSSLSTSDCTDTR